MSLVIPKIECIECKENCGHFQVEPLEKGLGITLGNVLRRILLGFLPGAAITRVKIEGIQHEFSTIPHIKEDTIEFLLNVKQIRIKPLSGQTGTLILDVAREGRVYAADIKPSTDFEVANPELYLATLDSPEARLYVEFDVEIGQGYLMAKSTDNMLVGSIPVDAIFTPIRKVNYTVEPIHTGREISHERLILDVWTDNTITPDAAVSQSANILIRQVTPFIDFARSTQVIAEQEQIRLSIPEEQYNMPIEQLDLSVRTLNALRRGGISTLGELLSKGEKDLLSLRNFGQKSKQEIEDRLKAMGLTLTLPPEEEPEAKPEEAGAEKTE